jgi:hypothetical protein
MEERWIGERSDAGEGSVGGEKDVGEGRVGRVRRRRRVGSEKRRIWTIDVAMKKPSRGEGLGGL